MKEVVLSALLVLVVLLSGCSLGKQPTPTPGVQESFVPVVSVTGELVPEVWTSLSSKMGGEVVEVLVTPGDLVSAEASLVRLDTADLELSLEVARQEVAAQQGVLDQLLAGATEEVVARADRENAQQVAQAEIVLQVKRQQLEQAQAKDPATDVAAAQARIQGLELQIAQTQAQDPAPEVTIAQVGMERATIALNDTQDEYNKALDRPWEDQAIRDTWAKRLEQAQLDYRSAQATLKRAFDAQRAHGIGLSALEAQLGEAQAMLAQAVDAQRAYSVTLDILNLEVEAAQAQLQYLRAWDNPYRDPPTQEQVDQARARLEQAQWNVAQVEQQIVDAETRAPFAGTVGQVEVKVGERVSPGQPLLALGDLDTLRVETTDLDEIDVVRVSVDQRVSVTFDALPDRVFQGRVRRISPMADSGSGGVHYTTIVDLEELDPILRWGMTAFVDIEVEGQ
jgi:multidrug efflux pump subunit AcrA (membrane-fusion protein)